MNRPRILGIGSALIDTLLPVDDAFLANHVPGGKGGMVCASRTEQDRWIGLAGREPVRAAGGAADNTLMALGHLGADTVLFAKIGHDPDGEFYRRKLLESNVEPRLVMSGSSGTGRCLELVTPDGERTMRTCLGASGELTPEEADRIDFSGFGLVYFAGYLFSNMPVLEKILDKARRAKCLVAMDLASFEVMETFRKEVLQALKCDIDMVFGNEEETSVLTGPGKSAEAMALELGKLCKVAAVKRGPQGSCVSVDGRLTVEKITPVHAVDTTAAGDNWAAGFLYGCMLGKTDAVSARMGSMVSAEVVQVYGSEMPETTWEKLRAKIGEL